MGYYTNYKLKVIRPDNKTNYEEEIGALSSYGEGTFEEDIKWYDHDKHMCEYSTNHPLTVFKLIGVGEENGDSWYKFYHNGKMVKECRAKLVFEEFDAEQYLRDNRIDQILQ